MGDDTAAYYKSLFLGQAEKGEQTKKAVSQRRKSSGAGPSVAKRAKTDAPPPLPKISEEAGDEPEAATVPPAEVAADLTAQSPTRSATLLDTLVEAPSAEERRRSKGKEISAEGTQGSDDDVTEVPPGLLSQTNCDAFTFLNFEIYLP